MTFPEIEPVDSRDAIAVVLDAYKSPKKVLIALPPAMLEMIDKVAKVEHRTRSDLVRESLRRYLDQFNRNRIVPPMPVPAKVLIVEEEPSYHLV